MLSNSKGSCILFVDIIFFFFYCIFSTKKSKSKRPIQKQKEEEMITHTERLNRVGPQLRPAGVYALPEGVGARELTSSYNPSGRQTPPQISKFHHRGPEVDATTRHWGLANDPEPDRDKRYGILFTNDDSMDVCLRPSIYADKMSTLIGEEREKRSKENRLKPLGRVPDPIFPIETPLKGFGASTLRTDTTKSIMNCWKDKEPMHPAGEQLCRGYDWEEKGIDFEKHRFGKVYASGEKAEDCFKNPVESNLVRKTVTDYNATVKSEVGKAKSYGFDNPKEWECNKNGIKKKQRGGMAADDFQLENTTMKDLLSSWSVGPVGENRPAWATEENCRKGRPGGAWERRHEAKEYPERPGVLRRVDREGDVKKNGFGRDVLTLTHLEDDATVQQLLHPCHYVSMGVESRYFAGGRPLEDIRALSKKCNFGLSDAQIDEVFQLTAKEGVCGIEQFKNAAIEKGYI